MSKEDQYRKGVAGLTKRQVDHARKQFSRDVTPSERSAFRQKSERVAEKNWRRNNS